MSDRPATILLPPFVYAVILALAWWLNRIVPLSFDAGQMGRLVTPILVITGLGITLWAATEIWRHDTTVNPYRAATHLVTTGPFRVSRNPIYTADWLIYLGVALWLRTGWAIILAPLTWFIMRYFIIAYEEAHLEAKFGDEYRAYTARVRRWL
jgi:protein-S-isoprenylcysteine O-methyltransferase Ste14